MAHRKRWSPRRHGLTWRGRGISLATVVVVVAAGSACTSPPHIAGARLAPTPGATSTVASAPTSSGPVPVPASLVGTEWTRLPTTQKLVALTFDAGANDAGVAPILATLTATSTPATFFLTGHFAQYYREDATRIGARFAVGNHTWSHLDLTTLSDAQVREQVATGQALIEEATGSDPRPLFRFPYGARDARTMALVNALGYGSIRWTVDTLGWMGRSGGQSVQSVEARVLSNLGPGEIVLMHVGSNPADGSTLDADALPTVISALRARGYQFVSVLSFLRSLLAPAGP